MLCVRRSGVIPGEKVAINFEWHRSFSNKAFLSLTYVRKLNYVRSLSLSLPLSGISAALDIQRCGWRLVQALNEMFSPQDQSSSEDRWEVGNSGGNYQRMGEVWVFQ